MEDVESFLGQIGEKRVTEGVEDTVRWMGAKNGMFSVKSVQCATTKICHLISLEVYMEELCSTKCVFLCLGGFLGKDSNF